MKTSHVAVSSPVPRSAPTEITPARSAPTEISEISGLGPDSPFSTPNAFATPQGRNLLPAFMSVGESPTSDELLAASFLDALMRDPPTPSEASVNTAPRRRIEPTPVTSAEPGSASNPIVID
jgi:hypothetical protein